MKSFISKLLLSMGLLQFPSILAENDEIKTKFLEHEIVPNFIAKAPDNPLKITFEGTLTVDYGNELTPTQVKSQPDVEWTAVENAFYTLFMLDLDAPIRTLPFLSEMKHWLVGNIPETSVEQGDVLAAYLSAAPFFDTGLHRYVFLLYQQSGRIDFEEKNVTKNNLEERLCFKTKDFAKKYKLGEPIAGNFYQAQYDDYVVNWTLKFLGV